MQSSSSKMFMLCIHLKKHWLRHLTSFGGIIIIYTWNEYISFPMTSKIYPFKLSYRYSVIHRNPLSFKYAFQQ